MKVFQNAREALSDIHDGVTLMSGGFGLAGIAENCIDELERRRVENLTVISNNIGNQGLGLAKLLKQRQITKAVCSYVGGNPDLEEQMLKHEIEVELVPQGTFSERIRAGGLGIRAFYTPTGYGTLAAEGKPTQTFDRPCVLETALSADFAILKAQKGDRYGNLWFQETARNFSPLMAMAARCTIVEVEELVEIGDLQEVHLPGIFVQRIFQGKDYQNTIEKMVIEQKTAAREGWDMSREVVKLLPPHSSVNLGIGLPTQVAQYLPEELDIWVQSENGVLGVAGRPASEAHASPTLINAGKETIVVRKGASFFDSALSFGMIRGGHIDTCVLGGLEVDVQGNLANWMIPGKKVTGMGGAMDLVNGAKQVIVMMNHFSKTGQSKLVERCQLPLTGLEVVDKVVTTHGVFAPTGGRFRVLKLAPGVEMAQLGPLFERETASL